MTFTELVADVMERMNLTSDEAEERVGRHINDRHRQVVSSIGLTASVRRVVTGLTVAGNRNVTFGNDDDTQSPGAEKVLSVFDATVTPARILREITFDDMRNRLPGTWPPHVYAIERMGHRSVKIQLDCEPTESDLVLSADVVRQTTTMEASDSPDFSQNFHDILVFGAMADEYDKLEKPELAQKAEAKFERRLSELRLFIAKTAYLDIAQGLRQSGRWSYPY